jgi:hypothetical protein
MKFKVQDSDPAMESLIDSFDDSIVEDQKYAEAMRAYQLLAASEAIEGCVPFIKEDPMLVDILGDDPAKWQDRLESVLVPATEGFWESFWTNGIIFGPIHAYAAKMSRMKIKFNNYLANKDEFNKTADPTQLVTTKLPTKDQFFKLTGALNTLFTELKRAANSDITTLDVDKLITALSGVGFKVTRTSVKGQYRWDWKAIAGSWIGALIVSVVIPGAGFFVSQAASRVGASLAKKDDNTAASKGWKKEDFPKMAQEMIKLIDSVQELSEVKSTARKTKPENMTPEQKELAKSNLKFLDQAAKVYAREVKELCYATAKLISGLTSNELVKSI